MKKFAHRFNQNFDIAQHATIGKGMPLLVELVMDTQVQKTNSDDGHYYSHTGNSWN